MLVRKYGFPEIMRMSDTQGAAEPDAGAPHAGGDAGGGQESFARDPLDTQREKGRMGIRESLEKGFSDARKAAPEERPSRGGKEGRFAPEGPKGGKAKEAPAAGAAPEEGDTKPDPGSQPGDVGATEAKDSNADQVKKLDPPATLKNNAEALAEWEKAPALAAAYARREEEMSKGVEKLKAAHAEVDQAIAPHAEAIRRHGHTPGQAVGQLFGWFQSIAANPKVALPALLQSFNVKPEDVFPQLRAAAPAAQATAAAVAGAGEPGAQPGVPAFELPEQYRQLMDGTFQKVNALEQQIQQQMQQQQAAQQRATEQIVTGWSKDKPHFERVRGQMAKLIQSGVVGLTAEGQVDLDGAYEAAVYADPELRTTMVADAQKKAQDAAAARAAAEQKAQQEAADKARAKAKGLAPSAPGAGPAAGAAAQRKKGMSVGESLREAMKEVRERA